MQDVEGVEELKQTEVGVEAGRVVTKSALDIETTRAVESTRDGKLQQGYDKVRQFLLKILHYLVIDKMYVQCQHSRAMRWIVEMFFAIASSFHRSEPGGRM